jgi:hypothetical protein
MDFRIPPLPSTATFSISGFVAGHPELATRPVETFHLISRDARSASSKSQNQSSDRSNGRFQIRGIRAGSYDLYPEFRDAQSRLWNGRIEIEVGDRDLENVRIPVTSGVDLRGRVVVDGTFPASDLFGETFSAYLSKGVTVSLDSEDNLPIDLLRQQTPASSFIDRATGEFTYRGVPAGRYRLRFSTILPEGLYFGDVRQDARSIFDEGIILGAETPNPVEVVIKTDGVRVQGIVQDASLRPVPGARVVLIPHPFGHLNADRYRATQSNREGRFEFRTTPPGDYKVFAWSGIPFNAWRNAEVMAASESRGVSIQIGKGPPSPMTVPIIPWTER